MEQDNKFNRNGVYSKRVRAGRRRTYFFDVRTTRANDYYLTITESKRRFDGDGYERHKLHLYKEDFNKFLEALAETVDYVKTDLMPEYDFDEYTRREDDDEYNSENRATPTTYTNELEESGGGEEETSQDNDEDLEW